jgi:hypothetical protein
VFVEHPRTTILVAALLTASPVGPRPAAAQNATPATCPPGNLLAGKKPWAWQDMRGRLALATDGEVAPEGALWSAPLAVILDTGAATVTWDLGAVTPVSAAWIQADANDDYTVGGSLDGRDFRELGRIPPVPGDGLRGRKLALGGTPVRFLRFGDGEGDGFYSLSEIQVFCEIPTPFPPPMRVGQAPVVPAARNIYSYWNDTSSARWELVLALLGLVLLYWEFALRRAGRPQAHRRLRDWLLAVLGLLAALSYVNFGFFHFGRFLHEHEWTHYYLGSKYSAELSYDRLYQCLSAADAEDGLRRRVERRPIMNLRTNMLEKTDQVLAHPEVCKSHFSEPRWQAFKRDVAFFRGRQGAREWDDEQIDHGYNATPVWNVAGKLLSNLCAASATQIYTLAMLDPLYLLATMAVIGWAFGWRVLSVALLVFATNFPNRYYWTGGSFLRWDWIFHTVAAVCCLKKARPALAGAALAYATSLRIFPLFVFAGPLLALAWRLYRRSSSSRGTTHARRPLTLTLSPADRGEGKWSVEKQLLRFFAGAAVAGVLLVSVSLAVSGGPLVYREFARNTLKHEGTAMTNNMGLRTVVAWRPDQVGRLIFNGGQVNPWGNWKRARIDAFRAAKPLYLMLVLGYLALLGLAARHAQPWVAAALSVTSIAVGVELTSYYYAFIIAVALLHTEREQVGRWLLLLTAFTQVIAWAPLPGMSTWFDEQHTAMSAASLAVFAAIVWLFRHPAPAPPSCAGSPSPLLPDLSPADRARRSDRLSGHI